MPTPGTISKARKVAELLEQYYEEGRQDRCKLWVYRNVVRKEFCEMSERTFWRMLKIVKSEQLKTKSYGD